MLAGTQVFLSNLSSCAGVVAQMREGNGIIETYAGESSALEGGSDVEPHEGMAFESEEAARAFYDDYARKKGFMTRVLSSRKSERDGSIVSRGLGCRGLPDNRTKDQMQKQCRQRDICTAMILLKRESPGRWVVRKFLTEHNHPLVVQLQKSRRILVSLLYLVLFSYWIVLLYSVFWCSPCHSLTPRNGELNCLGPFTLFFGALISSGILSD